MRYFVGQTEIDWSDNRYIGLFDRNTEDYVWFKIVEQCVTRYGYIAERDEPVVGYWANVILPEPMEVAR